jgi:hypothetical protein
LPAIVEADDGELYVVKFRGAGQGAKALLAELLVGQLALQAELPLPALVLVDVPHQFGRSEPDPEIQDLLRASRGVNVGLRYLDGAFNFDLAAAGDLLPAAFASRLAWFDTFVTNPDRTARNANLMIWQRTPWLIDHGAALYAHHAWPPFAEIAARATMPFSRVHEHLLLPLADDLLGADAFMRSRITPASIDAAVACLPDALLHDPSSGFSLSVDEARAYYRAYLSARLASAATWVQDAITVRERLSQQPPSTLAARR